MNNEHQQPLPSTIQKRKKDETHNCQMIKILSTGSKTTSDEICVNDLPPEMLMKVLNCLDTKYLLHCRLLNRTWNGDVTELLQSRPDLEVEFGHVQGTTNFKLIGKEEVDGMSLLDFIECFHASNNFPYTHFRFHGLGYSSFNNKHWNKFICELQEQVKCLKLSISPISPITSIFQNHMLTLITNKLRDLLFILKRHQLTQHPKEGEELPSFKCPLCEHSSKTKGDLSKHIQRHTREKFFKCDEPNCNFEAKTKREIQLHKVVHSDEKPFACSFESCEYRCKVKSALSTHLETHSEERRYKCELCPYRGKTRSTVKAHLKYVHSDSKFQPFKCPEPSCDFSAKTKQGLKLHQPTHRREKNAHGVS